MRLKTTRTRRGGYSLIETAITLAIVGVVASYGMMAARGGRRSFESTSRNTVLESQVRRALDRAAAELLTVGDGELLPDPTGSYGASDVAFRKAVGLTGTSIDWSNPMRLVREYEEGELDDDLDNDGDGLVDEGLLVLVRNEGLSNELRVVVGRGVTELLEGETFNGVDDNGNGIVDEAGFSMHREGDVLRLRLTMQAADKAGVVSTRTLETSVRIRN